ncbi:MAG: helix-turn-helix domain-containing protein [Alphaproteobacteria bacterium]|nr:helix-turn-helix domain-containing protein [Alphaproteobacteria bacterium]
MPQQTRDNEQVTSKSNAELCKDILDNIGQKLTRGREAQEMTIESVAKDLRIRGQLLRAIESGNIDEFPGDTYYYGFARSYAEMLAVDITDDIKQYRLQREQQEDRIQTDNKLADMVVNSVSGRGKIAAATIASTSNPVPNAKPLAKRSDREVVEQSSNLVQQMMSGSNPKTHNMAFILVGGFVLAMIYVLWLIFSGINEKSDLDDNQTVQSETLTDIDDILNGNADDTDSAEPEQNSVFRVVENVVQDVADKPATRNATRAGREYGNPVIANVALKTITSSWVSVIDVSQVNVNAGRTGEIFARQLQANDVYYAPQGKQIFVKVGNAGGVELIVNGESKGALGANGRVRYSALDATSITNGTHIRDGITLNEALETIKLEQSQ